MRDHLSPFALSLSKGTHESITFMGPVEGLHFFAGRKGQGFDKLSPNGERDVL